MATAPAVPPNIPAGPPVASGSIHKGADTIYELIEAEKAKAVSDLVRKLQDLDNSFAIFRDAALSIEKDYKKKISDKDNDLLRLRAEFSTLQDELKSQQQRSADNLDKLCSLAMRLQDYGVVYDLSETHLRWDTVWKDIIFELLQNRMPSNVSFDPSTFTASSLLQFAKNCNAMEHSVGWKRITQITAEEIRHMLENDPQIVHNVQSARISLLEKQLEDAQRALRSEPRDSSAEVVTFDNERTELQQLLSITSGKIASLESQLRDAEKVASEDQQNWKQQIESLEECLAREREALQYEREKVANLGEEREKETIRLKTEHQTAQAHVTSLQQQCAQLEQRLVSSNQSLYTSTQDLERLRSQLGTATARYNAECNRLEKAVDFLTNSLSDKDAEARQALETSEAERASLQIELSNYVAVQETLHQEAATVKRELDETMNALLLMKHDQEQDRMAGLEREERIRQETSLAESLKDKTAALEKERHNLRKELTSTTKTLTDKIFATAKQKLQLKTQLDALRTTVDAQEAARRKETVEKGAQTVSEVCEGASTLSLPEANPTSTADSAPRRNHPSRAINATISTIKGPNRPAMTLPRKRQSSSVDIAPIVPPPRKRLRVPSPLSSPVPISLAPSPLSVPPSAALPSQDVHRQTSNTPVSLVDKPPVTQHVEEKIIPLVSAPRKRAPQITAVSVPSPLSEPDPHYQAPSPAPAPSSAAPLSQDVRMQPRNTSVSLAQVPQHARKVRKQLARASVPLYLLKASRHVSVPSPLSESDSPFEAPSPLSVSSSPALPSQDVHMQTNNTSVSSAEKSRVPQPSLLVSHKVASTPKHPAAASVMDPGPSGGIEGKNTVAVTQTGSKSKAPRLSTLRASLPVFHKVAPPVMVPPSAASSSSNNSVQASNAPFQASSRVKLEPREVQLSAGQSTIPVAHPSPTIPTMPAIPDPEPAVTPAIKAARLRRPSWKVRTEDNAMTPPKKTTSSIDSDTDPATGYPYYDPPSSINRMDWDPDDVLEDFFLTCCPDSPSTSASLSKRSGSPLVEQPPAKKANTTKQSSKPVQQQSSKSVQQSSKSVQKSLKSAQKASKSVQKSAKSAQQSSKSSQKSSKSVQQPLNLGPSSELPANPFSKSSKPL